MTLDVLEPAFDSASPLDDPQHERFVQLVAKGDRSKGAVYAAIYGREVDDTAYANASRLLQRPEVKARLDYIRAKAAEGAELTVEWLLDELRDLYRVCRAEHDNTNANRALAQLAKVGGLNAAEKLETEVNIVIERY